MIPSDEPLNSIDTTTDSLRVTFGQLTERLHNTNKPWRTTIVVNSVREEQNVQPTLAKLKGNPILNHRKPPDSTIVSENDLYDDHVTDFNERTTRDSTPMPTTSTPIEMNSKKLANLQHRNLRKDLNNNSIEPLQKHSPKNLVKELNELIHSRNLNIINTFFSANPAKRTKRRELNLERIKLEDESKTIYSCTHPPLGQINSIQLKLMIHECKRAHQLGVLGGSNPNSPYHEFLHC